MALTAFLRRQAGRAYVALLVREAKERGFEPVKARRLAWSEVAAIPDTLVAHFDYQKSEATILSERLARRFDPGMAVNEAAQRAIAAKKAAGQPSPDNLTDKQRLGLELQEQHLKEVIRKS
jgi:hypothetical protein